METNIKNSGTEEYEIKQPVREGRHVLPGAVKLLRRSELEQENSQRDIWCFGWQGDSESLYVDQNYSDRRFAEILPCLSLLLAAVPSKGSKI